MTDKVLCPWCGGEMQLNQQLFLSFYVCRKCGAHGPVSIEGTELAYAATLRRYEPPCRPLTLEELEADSYCYPCWIEDAIYRPLFPEVLDKDSTGYFGKIDAANHKMVDYFMPKEYGKTWRCWPRRPTDAEREAAGWEDAE